MYIGYDLQTAVPGYLIIDDISSGFNGSATSFALLVGGVKPTPMPASPQQVLVSVNGVTQEPDPTGSAGFTVTGDNNVFSSAPTNGHAFFGIVLAGADYANAGGEFPDGTIAAPSFTFANDNDTGWFREGSGSVGFSANGSQILNYDGNGLNFVDSKKLQLGAGNDLQIYHDGSHSYIADSGTGDLNILASKVQILNPANSETMAIFREDGAIDLYHNNVVKFATTSGGIAVTGGINLTTNLSLLDDGIAKFGTGDDLQIYHDGSNSNIKNTTGWLNVSAGGSGFSVGNGDFSENLFKATNNGAVELYYDNTKRIETTTSGVTVSGSVTDDKGDVRKIVQNTQGSTYTLVAADAGKHILASGTVTVPNSTFSAGDAITIVNNTASNLTITKSITTMYNAADGTSANRTLATRGMATILFASGTVAYISGAGLS